MLAEIRRRFTNKNLENMRAIKSCSPISPNFFILDKVLSLAQSYSLDINLLSLECPLAKNTLKGKESKDIVSISDVLLEIYPLKVAFLIVIKLLQIALTIAISTTSCERSFSALNRINTYLRSTMTERG